MNKIKLSHNKTINCTIYKELTPDEWDYIKTKLNPLEERPYIKIDYTGKKSSFRIKSTRKGIEGFNDWDLHEILQTLDEIGKRVKISSDLEIIYK
jgi:hypothetical protein